MNSAPSVRAARSPALLNGACAANEPRLSP